MTLLAEVEKARELAEQVTLLHRIIPVGVALALATAIAYVLWRFIAKDYMQTVWQIIKEALEHDKKDDSNGRD